MQDLGLEWIQVFGYPAIFLLLLLGIVGLPIPDETILLFAGYLGFVGKLSILPTWGTAAVGSSCGMTISYSLGRWLGVRVKPKILASMRLTDARYEEIESWIRRWGPAALVVGYFIPGVRHLSALILGSSHVRYSIFARYAYAGACVWSGTFLALGYGLGAEWSSFSSAFARGTRWIGLSACLVVAVIGVHVFVQWRKRGNG